MKKGRIYLIVLAVVLVSVLFAALSQAENLPRHPQDPMLKEGEMFAVKLIPGAKKMEVLVTGREVGNIQATDLGLSASLIIGARTFTLEPQRNKDGFVIETPSESAAPGSSSKLQLKIRYGQSNENFEFDLKPQPTPKAAPEEKVKEKKN